MTIEAGQATAADSGSSSASSDTSISSSPSQGGEASIGSTGDVGSSEGINQPVAYTPNYQFKVYDKVHDFPEWIRPIVKDKAGEDQVRDLMSRAYGLDGIKSKYERTKQEMAQLGTYRDRYNEAQTQIQKLVSLRDNDLPSFLEQLGLDDERLVDYLTERARAKTDPNFAQEYNRQRELRQKMLASQEESSFATQQLNAIQEQNHTLQKNMLLFQLEQVVAKPEVESFSQQFDARMGQGQFRQHVIDMGNYVFHTQGRNLSPGEAVQAVMSKFSPFIGGGVAQSPVNQMSPGNVQSPPTIPNVGTGKGVSPTKPRFKSIKDIQQHYEKTYGS